MFKRISPNSNEQYRPENAARWRWHIEQHRERGKLEAKKWVQILPIGFTKLVEKRRVKSWAEFAEKTKSIYRHIAASFPGYPVFACGSRVRGDYTECLDGEDVKMWRRQAGKSDKERSDYDFYVSLEAPQTDALPEYADRLRHGVPDNEKILIPMQSWDFSKLPKSEYTSVIELFNNNKWSSLASIHDKYKLSPYSYCCGDSVKGLKKWFEWAIKTGIIRADTTNNGI